MADNNDESIEKTLSRLADEVREEEREELGREFKQSMLRLMCRSIFIDVLVLVFHLRNLLMLLVLIGLIWFIAVHGVSLKNAFGAIAIFVGTFGLLKSIRSYYIVAAGIEFGETPTPSLFDRRWFSALLLGVGVYFLW